MVKLELLASMKIHPVIDRKKKYKVEKILNRRNVRGKPKLFG